MGLAGKGGFKRLGNLERKGRGEVVFRYPGTLRLSPTRINGVPAQTGFLRTLT